MVASIVVQVLIGIFIIGMLYVLFKQQGRILLRLDDLELKASGASVPADLEIGTEVEDFRLPDLDGKRVSLSDFREKQVLLVYWSPSCGFCDALAPDLAQLQGTLKENNTEILLVSYGDAESNRKLAAEHGLTAPILLLEKAPAKKVIVDGIFRHQGTPSAYLLDPQGRVAEPLAVGAVTVLELARNALKGRARKALRKLPVAESRILRDGLPAGTPAPEFSLPDVHGETISLNQFRGQHVLLVFSDPHCGPCETLAPKLAQFYHKHRDNGLEVVMVGRGDPEENKKKTKEHGITFPVVIQEKWKLSRKYGIFATPVAFLIGGDGVIERNVAIGPDQIMALAQDGLASNSPARRAI